LKDNQLAIGTDTGCLLSQLGVAVGSVTEKAGIDERDGLDSQ
jgi:hypothetical protein